MWNILTIKISKAKIMTKEVNYVSLKFTKKFKK